MKRILFNSVAVLVAFFLTLPVLAVDNIVGSSGGEFIKVGAAGGQFLKIGVGGRGNGMAGAYSSVTNDLSGIFWNPAGVADVKGYSFLASYTSWFAGFNHAFAAFDMPLGDNFTVAAHFLRFGSGDIEITTFEEPNGTGLFYNVADISGGITLAGYLTDKFSFGVTAKYINHSLTNLSANGFAFDIGTKYETGIQGIKVGFAIMNLGTSQSYSGQDLMSTKKQNNGFSQAPIDVAYLAYPFEVPLIFRAGISSEILKVDDHKLLAAFDFISTSDIKEQFAIGVEYTMFDILNLRGGYLFGQNQFGLAGGVGLNYISGGLESSIDYSVNPTSDLGLVHRLSVNVGLK
jgi:hypothetical protein